MARQHIWRSPSIIPRDGSPILLLTHDFEVCACRYGVSKDSPEDNEGEAYWYSLDWTDVQMDDRPEERQRMIGWLPFPLIADPRPHHISEE